MKKLLFSALLLASGSALAQTAPPVGQEAAAPFTGASMIIVHTQDSAKVAYTKMARLILDAEYPLGKTDKELLVFNTLPHPAPRRNIQHALHFFVVPVAGGSDIRFTDRFTQPVAMAVLPTVKRDTETVYRGGDSSPFMICWAEMQRVAALYPGGKVSYKATR